MPTARAKAPFVDVTIERKYRASARRLECVLLDSGSGVIQGMLICVAATVGALGIAWLVLALKFRGPSAPLQVHPDDSWLVTSADVSWFTSTSEKMLRSLLKQDEATRWASWNSLLDQAGLPEDLATSRVFKSFPTYYVDPIKREDPHHVGDDAHLPVVIKDRVSRNPGLLSREEFEAAPERTMNAIIRRFIRDGRL